MSKKHYVANNTKYYKHSNRSEIDHVIRAMKKNENAFPELTPNNFGFTFDNESLNLKQNYELKLSEAKNQNPSAIQKQSNTFIDSVLAFDHELMHEILNTPNGEERVKESIKNYMAEFKEKYGFEPVGFQFHMDEGTFYKDEDFDKIEDEELKKRMVKTKNPETGEDGYLKQNFHAQAIFLNFNKETGKSCLRNMRKQDWRDCQDLLHKHFKEYGFDRGEPKQTASKDHKNKDEFIKSLEKKIGKLEQKERKLLTNIVEKNQQLGEIIDQMDGIAEDSIRFNDVRNSVVSAAVEIYNRKGVFSSVKKLYSKIKEKAPNLFNKLENARKTIMNKFEISIDELDMSQKQEIKQEIENKPEPEKPKEKLEDKTIKELEELVNKTNDSLDSKAKNQEEKIKKANNRRRHGRKNR